MEGMGEMEYLVHVGLKDRGERLDLRDQLEVGEKKGSKVQVAQSRTNWTERRARGIRSSWSKEWWGGLHKVGKNQLPKCHWN